MREDHRRRKEQDDFQRETLLRLQIAVRRFVLATGKVNSYYRMRHRETGASPDHPPDDAGDAFIKERGRVDMLSQRVLDDTTHDLNAELVNAGRLAVMAKTREESDEVMAQFSELITRVNQHIGGQLRDLLGPPQSTRPSQL